MDVASLHVPPSVVGLVVRGTLLLLVGLGGARVLRRAPAHVRHLMWLSVIAGVLLLPALARVGPIRVSMLPAASAAPMRVSQPR
ncbi:MAG TPA: hypothetical protein VMH39_06215, partial [Gemmatimonadaceae bacterium]|nr:hypothetical protein [Gemmatimonadaceae bacterium]